MSTHRTAWHFFFVILLRKRGPRWLEVREEVPLSEEPPRLDYLFSASSSAVLRTTWARPCAVCGRGCRSTPSPS